MSALMGVGPGQPGKNGGERAGLVGRGLDGVASVAQYTPDVVDANAAAWDVFVSSLDIDSLELERTHVTAPREVVVHDLLGERFGSRRHRELMWRHELVRVRSRAALASYVPEPVFTSEQLEIARRALSAVRGFAKGISGDETSSSTPGAMTEETVREGAPQRKEAA